MPGWQVTFVGATKMDRPEDIEVNPANEKVYIVCTNNSDRGDDGKEGKNAMNPRDNNEQGHIIELTETNDDHTLDTFGWEMFMVCGDPDDPETYFAGYDKSQVSSISCPDNIAFDNDGNLWIATDGAPKTLEKNDGFYACPVDGPERGKLRQFMSTVEGSEVCGPAFTPDGTTLFLAIQHPGENSSYAEPSTSWPDGTGAPRPSVIVVRASGREPDREPGRCRRSEPARLARFALESVGGLQTFRDFSWRIAGGRTPRLRFRRIGRR